MSRSGNENPQRGEQNKNQGKHPFEWLNFETKGVNQNPKQSNSGAKEKIGWKIWLGEGKFLKTCPKHHKLG